MLSSATLPLSRHGLSPLVMACLAATWLVWGSTYLAIKVALVSLPPFLQMGSRFFVAGALLMLWMRGRGAAMPTLAQWRNALIIGALMLGGGMGGTAVAEQTVGSGLVVAFVAVVPLMIALIQLAYGSRPTGGEWAGIAVGLAGVLLLVSGAGFQASPAGLTAQVIASVCWSLGSVLSQRNFRLAEGATGFASEMLCGGVLLLAIAAGTGETLPPHIEPSAIAAWAYLVVFGSLIAFNAYMVLLARAPAGLASSYTYVNPVIAMLLGVALGGEQISGLEWLAAGVILLGVLLLFRARSRA